MSGISHLKSIFLFILLCFVFDVLKAENPTLRAYSSSAIQGNVIGTGTYILRGIQIDEGAPSGVIKIWDSVGSTTSFSTAPFAVGGATICILDASGLGPYPYNGIWNIWTSSGLVFNQEGSIKFRIDYEVIRIR